MGDRRKPKKPKLPPAPDPETVRRFVAINMIADAEIRIAALRILLANPSVNVKLFAKRAAIVFDGVEHELRRLSSGEWKVQNG